MLLYLVLVHDFELMIPLDQVAVYRRLIDLLCISR
jgi:hypothetical protein